MGVAEAQVVAELLFELLEQHALVADFDEVEHFVRPSVFVGSEGEEHVEVIRALRHLVAGSQK